MWYVAGLTGYGCSSILLQFGLTQYPIHLCSISGDDEFFAPNCDGACGYVWRTVAAGLNKTFKGNHSQFLAVVSKGVIFLSPSTTDATISTMWDYAKAFLIFDTDRIPDSLK